MLPEIPDSHSLLLVSCQSAHKEASRPPADLDLTIFIGRIKRLRVGDWRQLAVTGQSISFSSLSSAVGKYGLLLNTLKAVKFTINLQNRGAIDDKEWTLT